jgi:hypothetical protein
MKASSTVDKDYGLINTSTEPMFHANYDKKLETINLNYTHEQNQSHAKRQFLGSASLLFNPNSTGTS